MTTNTLTNLEREEFEKLMVSFTSPDADYFGTNIGSADNIDEIWEFIQSLLTKQREEMREKIKGCIESDVDVLHVSLEKISDLLEQMEGEK